MMRGLILTLPTLTLLAPACSGVDPGCAEVVAGCSPDATSSGTDGGSSSGVGSTGGSTSHASDSGTSGTSGGSSASGASSTGSTGAPGDACDIIEGLTYGSLEPMECGLGPMGPELCTWTISFTAGGWEWNHSDVQESGRYTCTGFDIDGGTYSGWLDPMTGILTWEGAEYE